MGIMDFLKRKKETQEEPEENKEKFILNYSSGQKAEIDFGEIEQVEEKLLQKINIMYIEKNQSFKGKSYYVEPINLQRAENGDLINETEQYYKNLAKQNISLTKGFFKGEELDKLSTDYIGFIGQDEDGKYNRSYDNEFLVKYKDHYNELQAQKQAQNDTNNQKKDDDFMSDLKSRVEEPHIKTSHAQILTKEKYEEHYKNKKEDKLP
ncbi:MAG: hypothetical protein RSB67_03355 [Clostridia bacterium]